MLKSKKILKKIQLKKNNISFNEVEYLLKTLGFELTRITGSHHIFCSDRISEIINIQNVRGQVKPYQVRQIIRIIEKHNLGLEDSE